MSGVSEKQRDYEFLDCGNGRRLERFAAQVTVRPAPGAAHPPALSRRVWEQADLVFEPRRGWQGKEPANWQVTINGATLGLRLAGQGQVGVFPEHDSVCSLLAKKIASSAASPRPCTVLNLFAHTGLATLRLAALPGAGEIVHADASRSAINQAKANAVASGLGDAPIRWFVDDAMSLMAREIRRGRRYGLIVADPPSLGRDKKSGREWRFDRDIEELLSLAGSLLEPGSGMLCLTFHSEGWDGEMVAKLMNTLPGLPRRRHIETLTLESRQGGNPLFAGTAVLAH